MIKSKEWRYGNFSKFLPKNYYLLYFNEYRALSLYYKGGRPSCFFFRSAYQPFWTIDDKKEPWIDDSMNLKIFYKHIDITDHSDGNMKKMVKEINHPGLDLFDDIYSKELVRI